VPTDQPAHGRVLCLFAHPDDESFIVAGTTGWCAERGATVALVTATRGGAGRVGEPPLCTREQLAAVREDELRAATAILGITDLTVLDYPDGALAAAPPDQIRATLVAAIRRVRPHVAITFDPNGTNLHPDHIAISRFAIDALVAAADPRWFPEAGPPHHVPRLLWTPPVSPWIAPQLGWLSDPPPGIDIVLDIRPWTARKTAALRAHRTQHLQIDRIFFATPSAPSLAVEAFRQAWGPPGSDLFEGLSW
jgi:N-acetylglucosamine malate deacetylase 2